MVEARHLVASPGKVDTVPPLAARQVQDPQRWADLEQALDGVDLARRQVLQHRVIEIQVHRAEPGAPPVRVHTSIQLGQAARWRLAPYIDRSAASSSWSSVVPSVGYSATPNDTDAAVPSPEGAWSDSTIRAPKATASPRAQPCSNARNSSPPQRAAKSPGRACSVSAHATRRKRASP